MNNYCSRNQENAAEIPMWPFGRKKLANIREIRLTQDPHDKTDDYKAQRQSGKGDSWDVKKFRKREIICCGISESGYPIPEPKTVTDVEHIILGVDIRQAIATLEEIENTWGQNVRGLKKHWNHYARVRDLLSETAPPKPKAGKPKL
jgi:hypothetical protein